MVKDFNNPKYANTTDAVKAFKAGKIILYQSDTIASLGCMASSKEAIEAIYVLKNRDYSKKFILLVNSDRMLMSCVREVPELAWDLIDHSQSPLTLILPEAKKAYQHLANPEGFIAIRLSKSPFLIDLISKIGQPIVSTSVNLSGEEEAKNIDQALAFKPKVDFILDNPENTKGLHKASSIIKINMKNEIEILRQ